MKKFLAMAIAICIAVTMFPVSAFAASESIYVNGIDIILDADNTVDCGNGKAVYDSATQTLTLTNAEITVVSTARSLTDAGIVINGFENGDTVKIVLVGENKITLKDAEKANNGIWNDSKADLNIEGEGTLEIALFNSKGTPCGIFGNGTSVYIKDGTVDFSLDEGSKFGYIFDGKNFEAEDAKITGTGFGCGIFAGNIFSIKNSEIEISSDDAAIYGGMSGTIENSKINATATIEECSAICSEGNLDIINSEITATAAGNGIYAYGKVTFSKGSATITSTEGDAINAFGGITIKDEATVSATGVFAGIYTGAAVEIESGILSANGGDRAIVARKLSKGNSAEKPTDNPQAIILGDGIIEKNGHELKTNDWEWKYIDMWQSVSYFADAEGKDVKKVLIEKAEEKIPENKPEDKIEKDAIVITIDTAKEETEQEENPNTGAPIFVPVVLAAMITAVLAKNK